jgi:hypothetical protein
MKRIVWFLLLMISSHASAEYYNGSSFNGVWDILTESPYSNLPQKKVTFGSFFSRGVNLLQQSSKRTVSNQNDILPYFNKLLHPNGVCLSGEWNIQKENEYSGFFKKGSKGLIIARASTTLSNTRAGSYRGFGLAGKIFPTNNQNSTVKTANFFLIDNLVGTYAKNFTRVDLTNQPGLFPPFSFSIPFLIPVGIAASKALSAADINPGIRQVYSISQLGEHLSSNIKTPKWMKFSGVKNETISNQKDFREELREHILISNKLTFKISVASKTDETGKKWKDIGEVIFRDTIASEGCDHRLHFHHNKFKK